MKQEYIEEIREIIKDLVIALLAGVPFLALEKYIDINIYIRILIIVLAASLLILIGRFVIKNDLIELLNTCRNIRTSGVMKCVLYDPERTTSKTIIETSKTYIKEANESFFAFLEYGSRVTYDMTIFEQMVNRIYSERVDGKIKFIICNPESKLIDDGTREQIKETLKKLSGYKHRIQIKFYPLDYLPVLRVLFINDKYLILSFYPEDKNKPVTQLKIKNEENSMYVPIKEYAEQMWKHSTDVDWDKYVKEP